MRPGTTRRRFLQTSSWTLAGGCIVPYIFQGQTARAAEEKFDAKNDRPLVGAIGCGGQGTGIANAARQFGDLVAVCDVDKNHAERAAQRLTGGSATIIEDYRRLLERKDIEVVTIGTPDHWHTKIAIEAMQSGKDVYCEKPLTLTIEEGKLICQAVKNTGRVLQVGTQQRSSGPFARAIAIVREGRIGKLQRITAAIGGSPKGGPFPKIDPPAHLNWDFWLGQAPLVEYIPERCHANFRWWYEYSGGKMTDWGAHHVDIAHWAMGPDDSGPNSIEGTAVHPVELAKGYPVADDHFNTALEFRVLCKFPQGTELIICDRSDEFDNGVLLEGDQGRIFVNRGKLTGKAVEELSENPLPEDALKKVYNGKQHGNHMRNFFECVKTREQPISDVFSHHRALTTCHLANIAIRLGRPIQWDPATQTVVGDDEANAWQHRDQRKGYELPLV